MAGDDDELTIDQLAQRTGMTVRNVRAHQSRGLLPSPEVRGRTGYYGPEHVSRIELIKELQAEGFNLELIRRMLDTAGGSSNEVLRFTRALREPFGDEVPQIVEVTELMERWQTADPGLLAKAEQIGIMRPLGDGRYEEMSPRLARAGDELARLGIPAKDVLEIAARLRRHADSIARMFVELFIDRVWRPFDEEGRADERWPEVADAIERLRPLASEALLAIFQMAMEDAVEQGIGRELERDLKRSRK